LRLLLLPPLSLPLLREQRHSPPLLLHLPPQLPPPQLPQLHLLLLLLPRGQCCLLRSPSSTNADWCDCRQRQQDVCMASHR